MRRVFVAVMSLAMLVLASTLLRAQASKQLEGKAKNVATPQEQSWQQVDKINSETDKTKARYQQAQQSGKQGEQKPAYSVKKKGVGKKSAYGKPATPPQKKHKRK